MAQPTKSEQRERIVDAVVEVAAERGFGGVTVGEIIVRAGVPSSAFYEEFASRDAALNAAHETVFERFRARLVSACEGQSEWPLKVKVGIGVGLDFATAAPVRARFLALDGLASNLEIARRTTEARDRLARLLAGGRRETRYGAQLPGVTEQVLIGGLIGIVSSQLAAGEAKRLPGLAPELVYFTLLPYLGSEEAARVARRPKSEVEGL